MVSDDEVLDALRNVYDPEIGINIVDLGLVYDLRQENGQVAIDMTLTSMGCPAGPMLVQQIEEVLAGLDGVDGVSVQLIWNPPWSPSLMSEDAKMELGFF